MRVAVIGAGVAGLSSAHRLSQSGHVCDVYERWPGLGGQAATLDVGGGARIERYYHHLFMTDRHIEALARQLGMPDELEWRPSSVAMFADGRARAFTTPVDLLRYSPLSIHARLRLGAAVLLLQRRRLVEPFELITARAWIERYMGREVWEQVWGPLLRAKFGERADAIAMAWLWSASDRDDRLSRPDAGVDTGIPGLVLANTTQIYSEDRGTNYSVRLGWDAAPRSSPSRSAIGPG